MLKILYSGGFNGMKQGVIFTPISVDEEIRLLDDFPDWFEHIDDEDIDALSGTINSTSSRKKK